MFNVRVAVAALLGVLLVASCGQNAEPATSPQEKNQPSANKPVQKPPVHDPENQPSQKAPDPWMKDDWTRVILPPESKLRAKYFLQLPGLRVGETPEQRRAWWDSRVEFMPGLLERKKDQMHLELAIETPDDLSDAELKVAAAIPQIRWADLSWCTRISPKGWNSLKDFKGLRWLRIQADQRTTMDDKALHIATLPRLELLELGTGWASLSDLGAAHLAGAPSLKRLDVRDHRSLTDAALAQFAKLEHLEFLDLSYCHLISSDGLTHLKPLKQLREIDLIECAISNAGIQHLAAITTLEAIDVSNCSAITDAGLECLRGLDLRQLYAYGKRELSAPRFTDSTMALLATFPNLTHISFAGSGDFTDEGMKSLAKATKLIEVDISESYRISDSGLQSLSQLTCLEVLCLRQCSKITDSGLAQLAGLPELAVLDLNYCEKLTDKCIHHFCTHKKLESVDLGLTGVTDEGVRLLIGLKATLRVLRLERCNGVTDASLEVFKSLTKLDELNLVYTAVTKSCAGKVATALPKCRVHW